MLFKFRKKKKRVTKKFLWHKKHEDDMVWWGHTGEKGPLYISFDKKKIYNLWPDYPWNMTEEEVKIFDRENPFWADFFKDRKGIDKDDY